MHMQEACLLAVCQLWSKLYTQSIHQKHSLDFESRSSNAKKQALQNLWG